METFIAEILSGTIDFSYGLPKLEITIDAETETRTFWRIECKSVCQRVPECARGCAFMKLDLKAELGTKGHETKSFTHDNCGGASRFAE